MIAFIIGLNNLLGCIWHPIPKNLRADGQLTTLHLNEVPLTSITAPPTMSDSLEEQVTADDDESVDASQVEIRNPIQWKKLALITICICVDFALLVKWSH